MNQHAISIIGYRQSPRNRVNSGNPRFLSVKSAIATVSILAAALALGACRALPFMKQQPRTAWAFFTEAGSEPQGARLYTYVLFGETAAGAAPEVRKKASDLNHALLAAIASIPAGAQGAPEPANLFCIPATSTAPARPEVDNYNGAVANSYRASFASHVGTGHMARLISIRLLDNPGPFLASSVVPISLAQADTPTLIADLTGRDAANMKKVVASYLGLSPASAGGDKSPDDAKAILGEIAGRLKKAQVTPLMWPRQ